jgi:threonine/homoserine/homoserine lactone efflux protein
MVPMPSLVAFAITAAVIVVIPGPSVLFVIGRALVLGRAGALLSVVGNAAGFLVIVVAVAAGLGLLIEQSAILFTVIKFAGAGYLIFLGVQAIRHRRTPPATDATTARASKRRIFAESFVVGISNPKSIAFLVAVLPQFVDPSAGAVPLQLLELGLVFLVLALILDSCWALAAGAARDWFARSPRRVSVLGATGGVAMIGLGVGLAATGVKS